MILCNISYENSNNIESKPNVFKQFVREMPPKKARHEAVKEHRHQKPFTVKAQNSSAHTRSHTNGDQSRNSH